MTFFTTDTTIEFCQKLLSVRRTKNTKLFADGERYKLEYLIIIGICALLVFCIIIVYKQIANKTSQNSLKDTQKPIDSLNPPADYTPEMKDELRKVAAFCGSSHITQKDVQKFIIHQMSEDFLSMKGWDIWNSSIHETYGQFERMERATTDKSISILSYDPKHQLAKVQGKTAVYLTSCKRCSCPDYRKRYLPCKHMYALAMELDGDTEKCILDDKHPPLYGLTLALAGHLPKSKNGVGGIRADITDRGGTWTDSIEFDCSAVVMGTSPSLKRVERAKDFDMEILSPESIQTIFTNTYIEENTAGVTEESTQLS